MAEKEMKTRKVEYYRCWASSEGDRGMWDTDYIEIPYVTDGAGPTINALIEEAASEIDWKDGNAPLFVGLYAFCDEDDDVC